MGWDVDYLLLFVQCLLFFIGIVDDELCMMVDMDSRCISYGVEGEVVFLLYGGMIDFIENVNVVLCLLYEGLQVMIDFVQMLMINDLLELFMLDVEWFDGMYGQLLGFYIINEECLVVFDVISIGLLYQVDYLMLIYMVVVLFLNFMKLIKCYLVGVVV